MQQLGELHKNAGELLKKHQANVVVVFREEAEGQEGLKRVVASTKTQFTLALDTPADKTKRYSPGEQVHDSYVIDADGIIRGIIAGKRYDRATSEEFAEILESL